MITLEASYVPSMKTTASLTSLNVHGMDQTGNQSILLSITVLMQQKTSHMMRSKLKVVTHGYFPHQCTESHASVRVDRRYLDVFAVVSLTALDMMYALITLAHALGEKTLRIMSIFTQVINRLQKLKKNDANSHNPTNILRKLS